MVADSGSTDSTHAILKELQNTLPELEILEHTEKQHGPKVLALYRYAIEKGADFIFQTDSDGQTDPEEFDAFWKARKKYDAVLGYRRVREDGRFRAFAERVVCLLLRCFFGVKIPDANAPFRLMRTDLVKRYIDRLPADYNIPNIMLSAFFVYYHENVAFKTITFKAREGGVNSVNLFNIIKIGWKSLKDFGNFRREMRPASKI